MFQPQFIKGACTHCAGHLEFGADAVGGTIDCPHCGQPTELIPFAAPARPRLIITIIVAVIVSAGLVAGFIFLKKPAAVNSPPPSQLVPAPAEKPRVRPPDAVNTNDFAIATITLDKKSGSSLVYVTGKLRNLANRQRFGVKLAFDLFDRDDLPVGTAKDYVPVIEPHGSWNFKALVLESKAVSARFGDLHEDQ